MVSSRYKDNKNTLNNIEILTVKTSSIKGIYFYTNIYKTSLKIMEYITYIDESGNTGNDLLNSSQKIFCLASVSIPSSEM